MKIPYRMVILMVTIVSLWVMNAYSGSGGHTNLTVQERSNMSVGDRQKYLEENRIVPEDADRTDWELSQKTSWWGKPIDAGTFWSNRAIWFDQAARDEANRYGRFYPPVPVNAGIQPSSRDADVEMPGITSSEGGDIHFKFSNTEASFWNMHYIKTVKPPAEILREQTDVANKYFLHRMYHEKDPHALPEQPIEIDRFKKAILIGPIEQGYPPEAFTDTALTNAYIATQWDEYQRLISAGHATNDIRMKIFFSKVAVDPQKIINYSTNDIGQLHSWQCDYIQRLQTEKVDKVYYNVYLKAWNLKACTNLEKQIP